MISLDDARRLVLAVDEATEAEELPYYLVLDRVLAEDCGLLKAGTPLGPREIGVLVGQGVVRPKVFAPAIIGVVVARDQPPAEQGEDDETADPLAAALVAAIQQAGAIPLDMGLVPLNAELQGAAIVRALDSAHIVCLTGINREDDRARLRETVRHLNGEIVFDGVAHEVAEHLTFARFPEGLLFVLPADLTKMLACFDLFVRPPARRLAGHAER